VNFADAVFLGVWSKPGARFVCIEPWNGITDPQGFSDDFTRKPGVFIIAPGAGWSSRMLITLAPP
jgi:galactose mutarotase-like enzyme